MDEARPEDESDQFLGACGSPQAMSCAEKALQPGGREEVDRSSFPPGGRQIKRSPSLPLHLISGLSGGFTHLTNKYSTARTTC